MSAPSRATTSASPISRSFNTPPPVPLNRKKMSLQSVLQRGKAFLTPRNSSDSINQINSYIFPKVDPAIAGEDCDHDCETCEVKLPKGWKIDTEEKLYGRVDGWATHMLVATGKTDWVRDVSDEKGSVMEAVRDCKVEPSNGKLFLSASNMPLPNNNHHTSDPISTQPTTILLLPAFTYIDNVTPASVPNLITHYINRAPTTTTPLNPQIPSNFPPSPHELPTRPCPHKYLLLMCSQRTRDARCGQSAPLLKREFERHLRPLGLYRDAHDERPGGCGIYFISHVGGHKFSANLLVYRRADAVATTENEQPQTNGETTNGDAEKAQKRDGGEAAQCIWLARVRPEHCENIVKYTLLQGKVVKPESQLRGGFDRMKGVVSW